MASLTNRIQTKPTIFLIAGLLAVVICIPAIAYTMTLNGGRSMYVLLYFILLAAAGLALLIDVILVAYINHYIVSAIELVIIVLLFMFYSYNSRSAHFKVSNAPSLAYIVVIKDKKGISIKDFKRKGLFDKQFTTQDTGIYYINEESFKGYQLKFDNEKSSNYGYKPEYNFDWSFVNFSDKNFSYGMIDSIITSKLKPGIKLYNPNFKGY